MRHGKHLALVIFVLTSSLAAIVSCQQNRQVNLARPTTVASVSDDPDTIDAEGVRKLGFSFDPAPAIARPKDEVAAGSASCVACHTDSDAHTMHATDVGISCVDCHGGRSDVVVADPGDEQAKQLAHVRPTIPELWKSSANPEIPGALTLKESVDFIRFVNPGDLRAARAACFNCHADEVRKVERSMMSHGAMLWGAALYNNGTINRKDAVYGESYAADGSPQKVIQNPPPTTQQTREQGIVPALWPLPRWEITQPGNILRVFERGGKRRPILGVPDPFEEPGRPEVKLSIRGLGTDVRTDPVFIGLQKTRLLDPTLNFFGTNDHPGDFRGSGCTACHVVYANDRSPVHSGIWAKYGNLGKTQTRDPTIPKDESGHPIHHVFVKNVPTSSCIVCHVHPGTNVLNSYLGYMWWDNESDGQFMYPKQQRYPTGHDEFRVHQHNPEGAAARGLWSNLYPDAESHAGLKAGENFLENVTQLNPHLKHNQFADFHGHGWIFRAVYKQDRKGNLLDNDGQIVSFDDPQRWDKAVHLMDIHLQKGMHCVDCHFQQDSHGDGNLYGETRAAVTVDCIDCHGSYDQPAAIFRYLKDRRSDEADSLVSAAFTGNAAPKELDRKALLERKNFIGRRFQIKEDRLWQNSALDKDAGWFVVQTSETIRPDSAWATDASTPPRSIRQARFAHTIRRDGNTWGDLPKADNTLRELELAHGADRMSCYACHTSWNTSCFGCHLPMRANQRKTMLHNEGTVTRNYTNYNFQTLRNDMYMLGVDSTVKENKIVPIRSACAVLVSSQDANRQWIYTQQQTVSAEGLSGTAFSPYFPHTVRGIETRQCTDCHISSAGDNNAIMAQLLLQGTNSVNFIGRFAWIACGQGGLEAVAVTERDEPQAVIGSRLHEHAYPDFYSNHTSRGMKLAESYDHHGTVLDVQLRGEYLYAACGTDGFIAYDVANIDNKGFSERIITAPVSPLGQRFYVRSKYATSICSPSTMAIDPTRPQRAENEEAPVHPLYAYLYLTDREEGLIVIGNPPHEKRNKPGVATLLDGDPDNNFLQRAVTYNPGGLLSGARHMALCGNFAYVSADAGLVVLDLHDPLAPKHVTTLASPHFSRVRKIAFQFRYGFVLDEQGVKVIDVTFPDRPRVVEGATVPLADPRDIYVSRTYGYVAAGKQGLVILDLEKPEQPAVDQIFDADGQLNDATAVRVGMTNVSLFAYVADGRNGLRVLQLTSPDDTPTFHGFSPRPRPRLIAWHKTHGPAISLSEGLDRDRAVDESGNQLAVFGRRGARPFNLIEQQRLFLRAMEDGRKSVYTVSDEPTTEPIAPATQPEAAPTTEPSPSPRRRLPGRR